MLNDNYNIAELPKLDIPRSKFEKSHKHLTTFNVGELIPIFCDEILPGTTVNIRTNKLVRLQTLITPIFDNLMMDTYFFFVPNRLVWDHWNEFMGENTSGHWYPQVQYAIPTIEAVNGFAAGSVADHFGVPINCDNTVVNALPFRAYAKIFNDYFRDENLTDPVLIYTGDNTVQAVDTGNYINDGAKGVSPLKVAKYKDLFTTALPAPQKGPIISIGGNGLLPVNVGNAHSVPDSTFTLKYKGTSSIGQWFNLWSQGIDGNNLVLKADYESTGPSGDQYYAVPNNLWAELDSNILSINNLRLAFATQKLIERDARYGTRYTEVLQGHFGITSPDARLQRPEFIGGNHCHLYVDSVVQQSETGDTPLGNLGAYSITADANDDVQSYSALEHGFIIGVACVRYEHTYQQGLDKMWSRRYRLDYYWPELSNIGEIGISGKEVCMLPYSASDQTTEETKREEIFGYQEAWYDYRYKKNYVSGEMHSGISNTLDYWHLADYYSSHPVLGDAWIREDGSVVDRVIAVSQRVSDQVLADFWFEYDYIAPLPVYSIPGLIDIR